MSEIQLLEKLALQNRVFPEVSPCQKHLASLWHQKLTTVFGRDSVKFARDIFGVEVSLDLLKKVFSLHALISARAQEQPQLLPLLAPFVRLDTCPADFAKVRQYYGLSGQSWKTLCHAPPRAIADIGPYLKKTYCKNWLELVAQSQSESIPELLDLFNQGRPAGFVHYDSMLEDSQWQSAQVQLKRLFVLFGKVTKGLDKQSQAYGQTRDCLEALGAELYPEILAGRACVHKNSTFDSLVRWLNERWTASADVVRALSGEAVLKFPSIGLEQFESDNFHWKFIEDSHRLILEGQVMRHCVGNASYISSAAQGKSVLFSVTKRNSPLSIRATLELIRCESGFICSQIKGPGNSGVSGKMVEEVSQLIAELSNRK